jgi:anti-sigma factor RsiW
MTSTITCGEFVELVTGYLEDALDPGTRQRFEDHLALCPGCDTYVAQIRQTARIAGHLDEQHLREPARSHLLDAFREWNTPQP